MVSVARFAVVGCPNHRCQAKEEKFEKNDISAPQAIGYLFVPITKAN